MRLLATAGLLLIAAAPPPSPADDARAALRAALTLPDDSYRHVSGNRPCIVQETVPQHVQLPPFGRRRLRTIPYPWYHDAGRSDGRGERLTAAAEARVQGAERRAWTVPAEVRSVERIEANWLPTGFSFCAGARYEAPLEFSAPVIVDDLAFVTLDFRCPLCGRGMLYAFQRRAGGWALLAWTEQWIS
ncbi:hypothetical protein [Allosphingosinicella sp.]|uniref:hypothetical protein n=1 Tax=Allosphingosinicella sp. TaxID=2823234 RepID=UPI00378400DA